VTNALLPTAAAKYIRRMAQWKDDRHDRAVHEAAHAVVARKLGLAVPHVTIRKGCAHALSESASYLAQDADVATRIVALEKDAMVQQAGFDANAHDYPYPVEAPDLFDVADDADTDTINTRDIIYKIFCLQTGRPFNGSGEDITVGRDVMSAMNEIYKQVIHKTYVLVDQNWPTILRVAKHLERHGDIDDQASLDRLILRN
jgi:hypothetical protein